jgi:hypothetical protein
MTSPNVWVACVCLVVFLARDAQGTATLVQLDITEFDQISGVASGINSVLFISEQSVYAQFKDVTIVSAHGDIIQTNVGITTTHACDNAKISLRIVGNTTVSVMANSSLVPGIYVQTSGEYTLPNFVYSLSWFCVELNSVDSINVTVSDQTHCHNGGVIHFHVASIRFNIDEINWLFLFSASSGICLSILIAICIRRNRLDKLKQITK